MTRKTIECGMCGVEVERTSNAQKYCPECRQNLRNKKWLYEAEGRKSDPKSRAGWPDKYRAPKKPSPVRMVRCDRAGGKSCAYWLPLFKANGNVKCCHYILYTGHSTGWDNPCKVQRSGTVSPLTDTGMKIVRSRYDGLDRYDCNNAYKRK